MVEMAFQILKRKLKVQCVTIDGEFPDHVTKLPG